ncbi:MAG: c-type cytochrome [Methylococcales bacterium]
MDLKINAIGIVLLFGLAMSAQTQANDVFDKHCSSCHAGGGNIMNAAKGLSKENLDANGVNSVDKIKALVTDGKVPMPAFGKMLSAKEIENVSAFVLKQAATGWK